MQISRSFLVACGAAYCLALLPLCATDADVEWSRLREALRQKMNQLDAQPAPAVPQTAVVAPSVQKAPAPVAQPAPASTPAPAAQATTTAGQSPAPAPQPPTKPKAIKGQQSLPPLQNAPPAVSADKEQRLQELLSKYKADQISPEEYHQQRAKILAEP
jgi:hypothetical protein